MHFIRKINKNVQESFSIINEGIQITNGILEIKSVHLPRLLQLSAKRNVKEEESAICCIFEEYGPGRRKGVRVNDNKIQESRESSEPRVKQRLVSKLKFLHGENGGLEGGEGGKNGVGGEATCSLGENCVLRRFSEHSYRESVEFVDAFLKSLTRVLEDTSSSSRKVVENQSFLTLYEISQLYDAALVLKSQAGRLVKLEERMEGLQSSLLALVAQALKLLNEMLVYPSHIYFGNLNREYDDGKIERRKYDELVKRRFGEEKVDEYELVGSFAFINVNEEEKRDLDEYLKCIDAILDASEDAKQVMEALSVTYDGEDAEWNEVFHGFLQLFQKIFAYNDVNWHVAQESGALYLWNRHYDACSHYVYHEERCYDCTKPKMDPDLEAKEDYCACLLSTQRCSFRVKVAVEEAMRSDLSGAKQLLGLLRSVKQLYIKSRLLELMSQLTAQVEGFADAFVKQGALQSVFGSLEACSKDHFYFLDTTLNAAAQEEQKPAPHLALVNEKDLKIFMSFPPCAAEALRLIHSYAVSSRRHVSAKEAASLARYAKNLVLVYTYYNCTHEASKSMELLGAFSQVLHVALESALFAQVCVRDLGARGEPFLRHVVEKLDSAGRTADVEARSSRLDLELCNMVTCSLVILMNLSKLGSFVESQAIRSFTNFLSVYMSALNGRGGESAVERLSSMRVGDLPELYNRMLRVLHTKETQLRGDLEDVVKMKVASFTDLEGLPIFQLAASLLDPYINTRVTSRFTGEVFKLAPKLGVFDGDTATGRGLKRYFSRQCEELSALLDQEFDDGQLVFYRKFVFNYTALLTANVDTGEGRPKVELLEEYGLKYVLSTLAKMISIPKFKSGGNLENIFQCMLTSLMMSTMAVEYGSGLKGTDYTPLLELISMERSYGGHSRGLASVVVLYLFIVGFDMEGRGAAVFKERVDLEVLSKMHEEVNRMYFSKEFKSAEIALKLDDVQPVDTLGLGFEESLRRFRASVANTTKSDLIELYYWNQNNFYNFSLPPRVFKKLIAFKHYLHPHLFGTVSRCLSRFAKPNLTLGRMKDKTRHASTMDSDDRGLDMAGTSGCEESDSKGNGKPVDFTRYDKSSQVSVHDVRRPEECESGFHAESLSNNVLDEPMKIMKNLYEGQLEFAKAKLFKMESQLHVLANSLQLSQMTNENMRNRIKLLEKQVEPSCEDNLAVELERERQKYDHLEQMYNKLLVHLNDIGLKNTETNLI